MDTMPDDEVLVTLGVDTHRDFHVVAALDGLGRELGSTTVATSAYGTRRLLSWAGEFGVIDRVGVEGTGSYGARLSRALRAEGLVVVEVDRPDRRDRRFNGKSDTRDAFSAARAVLSGRATGSPKAGTGNVEMIRILRTTRRSAVKARTQALNQLHALVVTAPEQLHARMRPLTTRERVTVAAAFRPGAPGDIEVTAKFALRSLARRVHDLDAEIATLNQQLERLVKATAPRLRATLGVATHVAATLLVTAGDNVERLHNEGSFAHLTGTAPLDASSGRQQRHGFNYGGDRHANAALYTIAITRLRCDERTKNYYRRREHDGLTKKEIIRCIKRYIAREIYDTLRADLGITTCAT